MSEPCERRHHQRGRTSGGWCAAPPQRVMGLLVPLLAAHLLLADLALCEEYTTKIPTEGVDLYAKYGDQQQHGPNNLGAAWQIFGSNAMRQSEGRLVKAKTRKVKAHQKDSRPQLPPGKIMMAPPRRRTFHQNASVAIDRSAGLAHHPIGTAGGGGAGVYGSLSHYDTLYGIRGVERRDNDGLRPFERFGPAGGHIGGYHRHPDDDIFRSDDELLLESPGGGGGGGSGGPSSGKPPDLGMGVPLEHCDIRCEPREFRCDKSCACIHMDLHCDGQADCVLAEDEQNCEAVHQLLAQQIKDNCETSGTHVICATTHTCISREWLCDGDDDCGDFTDETHCGTRLDCTEGKFECQNGMCIPPDWVCDGDNDCNDLSDERNCTKQCTRDEFRCKDGSCISASFQCDGEMDCIDESDEADCDRPMQNCPEGEYKCKGALGGMGGPGGRCVLMRFRCDGDNDCGDWSDEENCPKKQVDCMINEFKCDDGDCIPLQWRCDDKQDCNNGEDEKNCPVDRGTAGRACSADEYTCKDGRCILRSWVCDGSADCRRGEDEQDCDIKCELNQFLCPTGTRNSTRDPVCINQKHVCDGYGDCANGEDEQRCPIAHPCGAHARCEQLCVTAYSGREECMCRAGYLLHGNGYNCTDIDECAIVASPVCSQQCTNVAGSFRCSCQPGYVLRPDQRTCKAIGGSVKLLMANRADIRQVSLSGGSNQYTSIAKGLPNAIALDYHYRRDLLFWTDVSIDVIKRSHLNGSGVRDVIKWGLESPGGLAVDWVHDLLFWTDSGTRRVEVATLDGQMRAVIAANELDKPRAIAVHPGRAAVFWTDWGTSPRIEKAYMDGSERQTLIAEAIFWPNGLAIDYTSDRIYWADAKHVIESANFDGKARRKILSNNLPHPFALALFEDSMYWTDWHTKTISSASKVNGRGFRVVHEGLHFPMGIQSYHPSRQPDYPNRCPADPLPGGRRGGCSHLCLPTRTHRRCACPIGLTLRSDQRTCSTVPDKLLLIVRKKDVRVRQLDAANPVDMVLPLDGIKSTVAVDWCARTNAIYWTDVGKSLISRAFINGSGQEPIVRSNLISPAGLALDWITQKIYWTDPGTNRIEAATTDGRQRALLVWERLDKPRDIVVQPAEGYMFWSDWGSNPLIERAAMDGGGRFTLVSENLQWPNGLALDVDKQRLYFLDGGTKSLEYVNYDGTGRNRLIQEGLRHPFGLDVYERRVYWTDWDTHSIQVANMYTGADRHTILANNSDLMDIRVFHRNRRESRNPCAHKNGGCSYLCLLKPASYSCACPIGIQLQDNGKTCKSGPANYLIFAHRTEIRQVSLDSDYQIDVVLPLPPISNAVTLDVDRATGEVYWADTIEDVIMRSTPDGMRIKQIYSESMTSVDGLVLDSIGRKLYWTDAGRKVLEVSDLDGDGSRSALVWRDLEQPRGIALDYDSGLLFWSDWGADPRIERADMDGENRRPLISEGLGWPNGLTVDRAERRIYWADAQMKTIESAGLGGTQRTRLVENLPHPYALAVTARHIYWTDWITKALHTVPKVQPHGTGATGAAAAAAAAASHIRNVTHGLEGLMDVKVVQEDDGYQLENVCGKANGGCSHLCLRNPTGYSCKCPTGLTMREGSTSDCKTLPDEFLLIALRSGIGRISLDTPDLFDVVLPIEGVHGAVVLDYHYDALQVYYADVNVDAIRRVSMQNVSDTQVIVARGLNTPNGLAVDWLADNLYWTDTALKRIEVARLDGSCRKAILTDRLDDPRSLILYPKRGFLFWADWGATPKIERAYMDGSGRRSVVDFELGFPTGLAIDFDTKRLYWADALQDRIEMCDFDGRRRTPVVAHATHPFGFTLTATHLYWTDWYNKSVLRASKDSVANVEVARFNLRGALEVRSVSGARQPHDWNPCRRDNGGCSHLCLYAETSYVCGCPDVPDPSGRPCHLEPTFVVPIRPNDELLLSHQDQNRPIKSNGSTVLSTSKMHAQLVIIATAILAGLLIIVIITILVLIVNSKRKQTKKSARIANDVLTFTNPNYNGIDGLYQVGDAASSAASRNTIWKRLKYDRAQERVYEEKYLGMQHGTGGGGTFLATGGTAPTTVMTPGSAVLPV